MTISKFGIFRYLLVPIVLLCAGCVTVVLDNKDVMEPPNPDPVRFADPICLKLNFKTDNIGFFNEQEGLRPMEELQLLRSSAGLAYYNIIQDCATPVSEYTVIISSQTKNWWARSIWAATSFLTLGVVPFYVKETGVISVVDNNGQVVAESNYEEKRLTSIFALPKWLIDFNKSTKLYSVAPDIATINRREAILLKKATEKTLSNDVP